MAYVILDANNNIVSMFKVAQNDPAPGYAVIDDDDPRIAPWLAEFGNPMARLQANT